MVARANYPRWAPRALGAAAIALAALFAAVGLWQAATHKLFFFAPNLAVSNANTDYFRVTSLFGDPSLYGRHVVLGIGVVLALLATRRWRTWPGIALLALIWAGLVFSYSQSSMVALLVVTLALSLATGDRGPPRVAPCRRPRCWRCALRGRAARPRRLAQQDHERPDRARGGRRRE